MPVAPLEVRSHPIAGLVLYLLDRQVHPGAVVEVLWKNRAWVRGVLALDGPDQLVVLKVHDHKKIRFLHLPDSALLRWPS